MVDFAWAMTLIDRFPRNYLLSAPLNVLVSPTPSPFTPLRLVRPGHSTEISSDWARTC
jgi:hypothetical protein